MQNPRGEYRVALFPDLIGTSGAIFRLRRCRGRMERGPREPGAYERAPNARDSCDLPDRSEGLLDSGERDAELRAAPRAGFDREVPAHGGQEAVRDREAQTGRRGMVLDIGHVEPVEERCEAIGVDSRSTIDEGNEGLHRIGCDPNLNAIPTPAEVNRIVEQRFEHREEMTRMDAGDKGRGAVDLHVAAAS